MKAVCVVNETGLAVRDIPEPIQPADNHVLIKMEASGINSGDKYFLANPAARAAFGVAPATHGASGVGKVIAIGEGVPSKYLNKNVAVYRSLVRSAEVVGLWAETSHIHYLCCAILPDEVNAIDYAGSLVNIFTAYAFFDKALQDGHKGIIATAGNSATGLALYEIAHRKNIPVILNVRSKESKDELNSQGIETVIAVSDEHFDSAFKNLAEKLSATAIYDGVGAELIDRLALIVPRESTFYCYGFLGGMKPFKMESRLLLERALTLRGFSNFMTKLAQDQKLLEAALDDISTMIESPRFRTKIGKKFSLDEIDKAMQFAGDNGAKAVVTAN